MVMQPMSPHTPLQPAASSGEMSAALAASQGASEQLQVILSIQPCASGLPALCISAQPDVAASCA